MFNIFFKNVEKDKIIKAESAVATINALEKEISMLGNIEIKEKIQKLSQAAQFNSNLDILLPQSFALTREMSKRVLNLRHFDSQLIGGYVLNEGKIAEMKTGEGKTLAATLPIVLNALTLKGAHLVTVNDYLAKRDEQWMGQIYRALGLSVGLIQEGMEESQRRLNYAADITYVTNSELAFDYLRDNMANSLQELVQRPYFYAIVDEVDSILIDEARTPLIISDEQKIPIEKYVVADEITKYLKPDIDYIVDEKTKNVTLTDIGINQVENLLQISNLYDIDDPWSPYINNALKAQCLFLKNTNYIVKNNEILIVDEFTGRIMSDRRWGDGLHQAIEAKEKVTIKQGSETLGSITYQNFFRLYPKLAGMTGTAKTAEEELRKIYNLEVVEIPTSRPIERKDLNDLIYRDEYTKWKEIAQQCKKLHNIGQPILIGTTTIEKSEIISQLLDELQINHQVLNAKPQNVRRESEIIAQAGCYKAVTVATNMAGRGTDIILGGNSKFKTRQQLKIFLLVLKANKKFTANLKLLFQTRQLNREILKKFLYTIYLLEEYEIDQIALTNDEIDLFPNIDYLNKILTLFFLQAYKKNDKICQQEREKIKKIGGLYVIGTTRHESKRIDNQLRGRAGRQGDPGVSRFYLSLDDDLLRVFSGDKIKVIMDTLNLSNEALDSSAFSQSLDTAQKRVEDYFYETRKQLFEYDEILNIQRLTFFKERRALLENKNIRLEILKYGEMLMFDYSLRLIKDNSNLRKLNNEISYFLRLPFYILPTTQLEIYEFLKRQFWIRYELKEAECEIFACGFMRLLEKDLLLLEVDKNWKQHLKEMDILKESIRWRGYGQLNPLLEYKKEGFNLLVETIQNIKYNTVYTIMQSKYI